MEQICIKSISRSTKSIFRLLSPSFQGVNRPFILLFENNGDRTVHTKFYLTPVETKDYSVMMNGRNFFDQPVKNNLIRYHNIRKIATDQGDDYTTGCLLDYNYFNNYYKMIVIVNIKNLMLIQKQYKKILLKEIQVDKMQEIKI